MPLPWRRMSVDWRTRSDATAPSEVDPVEMFDVELPSAFAAAAERLSTPGVRLPADLQVEVDGRTWRMWVDDDGVHVARAGGGSIPVLRLDSGQVRDLVIDQSTPISWLADGTLRLEGAGLPVVLDWWMLIRSALDGTTPHSAGAVTMLDPDGSPLDLTRTFYPDDDPQELGHFLHEAGFVHIAAVYDASEMAAVSADMDRIAPTYAPDDGRSWWAELADGTNALVRMQGFDERSEAAADLLADERLSDIGRLTGDGHHVAPSLNRIEALFKPLGVRRGISDIPWHKDCSIGRHSYDCCSLTVGISVTGADARSGQLQVVAGSHRALMWPAPGLQPGLDLAVLDLPTRTGDVTVHLSCTMHTAQPPVEQPRRVLYTSLVMDPLDADAHRHARARRDSVRNAAPLTVSQPAVG